MENYTLNIVTDNDVYKGSFEDYMEENARRVIRQAENPHPMLITAIVVVLMFLVIVILYRNRNKDIEGEWFNVADERILPINILQEVWLGHIVVQYDDGSIQFGTISGNTITLKKDGISIKWGVYEDGKILWNDGSIWGRLYSINF